MAVGMQSEIQRVYTRVLFFFFFISWIHFECRGNDSPANSIALMKGGGCNPLLLLLLLLCEINIPRMDFRGHE